GATLAEFDPGRYKTTEQDRRVPPALTLIWPSAAEAERPVIEGAAARGRLVAACANIARELINEPGNLLPPRLLAERAAAIAQGTGLSVEVLDDRRIADLGMGLLAGVARGSQEPPCLIVIEHAPRTAPAGPVLGLVGKGVTFDSGGISIKTSAGMDRMKDDMAGGAAVIASLRAIALLDLPIRVVGVVPAVENMPSGNAVKPGDVLRGASGRTVEVIDTDAEGRLILGDALWYARERGATHLVDLATLTGACTVALGKTTTGLFGRPDDWAGRVGSLAEECGERCWRLPLVDDYRELLKSEIADTTNVGGRHGGAITAALFLEAFAGDVPWVHLDIAGTAWNDEARPYMPKGPTGVGVRTMTALAAALAGR
ncbi:MAG TPA: leucyl aminopeptidase, partial [Vicinamibacterales bacterium]|nr:leucyl aminopeptidase [Vicinamibacterales bacterium]